MVMGPGSGFCIFTFWPRSPPVAAALLYYERYYQYFLAVSSWLAELLLPG